MAKTEVLILSDSHGKSDAIERAITLTRPQLILFCGDGLRDFAYLPLPCPLYAVRGNCDAFTLSAFEDIQEDIILHLDGLKLLVTHGHRYGVKSGLGTLIAKAAREEIDAVIFGHTHEPLDLTLTPAHTPSDLGISLQRPLHLFNPGSLGYRPHAFGTLTIRDGVPLFGHGTLPY